MTRIKIILVALAALLVMPFLYSCDSGDLQTLINWAKLWAMVHDVTDADGNPNAGGIARFTVGEAFGFGTTGDEEGDAAIDSAVMLRNLRDAENEADAGWSALYSGRNIQEGVLPHYNKAISLRGDDWSYRNERGIAYLEDINNTDNAKLAKADFDKATELAKKSGKPAEYLRMLKEREQAMARLVQHDKDQSAYPTKDMYDEQSRLYGELYQLTKDNNYLLLKQQADTNLKEGYYWQRDPVK
jgi:hypothetical protein